MRVNFIFCLTRTESFPWATAGKYVSSCVLFSTALITHLTFRTMARTWYFGQTHPGTSSRAPDRPRGQCFSLPSLAPAGGLLPPSQMVQEPGRHPQAPERPSQCQFPELWPSVFWRLRSWQQTSSPADTCIETHGCMAHKHNRWQTPYRPQLIFYFNFLGWMSCATSHACLIALCKYHVCRAIVHMFTGIRLFLCSICPLESSYHHSWT